MGARQELAAAADGLRRQLYRSGSERRPLLSERRPSARLRAPGSRTAGQPPFAAAGRELSSIMVGAAGAAAGAVQRAGRTAGHHLRAAGAGSSRFQAAPAQRSALGKQALQETKPTKTPYRRD